MIYIYVIIFSLCSASQITENEKKLLASFNGTPNVADYYSLEELMAGDFNTDIETHNLMYSFCMYNDNLDCANLHLNKSITLNPKDKTLRDISTSLSEYRELLSRAKKTIERELYDEALRDYDNIISTYPERALPFYEKGVVYLKKSDYENAVINFTKAITLNPFKDTYKSSVVSVAQRIAKEADEAAKRQDYNVAIPKYKAAIEYHPEFTEALFNLSKTFYRLDDTDNAKVYLLKNLSVNENQAQSLKMLADIYKKERNTDDAIKYYNKAVKVKPDYFQAYYSLGILLIRSDLNLAKEKLMMATDIRTDYYKAHETLGIVNIQLGNYDQALLNFKTTIELLESKPPRKRSYKSFYLSSQIYLCKGEFLLAKEYAKGALDIKSNCAPAYLYLGIAEKNLKNRPAAIDAFNLARSDKDWRESADFEIKNYEKDTSRNIGCIN